MKKNLPVFVLASILLFAGCSRERYVVSNFYYKDFNKLWRLIKNALDREGFKIAKLKRPRGAKPGVIETYWKAPPSDIKSINTIRKKAFVKVFSNADVNTVKIMVKMEENMKPTSLQNPKYDWKFKGFDKDTEESMFYYIRLELKRMGREKSS